MVEGRFLAEVGSKTRGRGGIQGVPRITGSCTMSAKRPCHNPVAFEGEEEVFPLHITPGYVPKWQAWEGVREFVQNWHDGVLSTFEQIGGAAERPVHFDKVSQ